jgi:hypothetical protein
MKTRIALLLLALVTTFVLSGCAQSSPSAVVNKFWEYVEKGQYDKAAALNSQTMLRAGVAISVEEIRLIKQDWDARGGVKSRKITKETIIRDQASVEAEVADGEGTVWNCGYALVMEGKDWRLNSLLYWACLPSSPP